MNNLNLIPLQQGLASINNEELLQVYHLWKAIHEKREHTMLQNIYNYSSAHCYAVAFLVGNAHRKLICEKLNHYEKKEALKLTWTFFNE